jgi:hypothetical protein
MISTFISPLAGWRAPSPPVPKPLPSQPCAPAQPDWRDHAAEERWEEAIVAYLRTDWRMTFKMWTVINEIVRESGQRSRVDVRAATFEVLKEVMRLRRERVVFRYKKRWISILDSGVPIIPLGELPPIRSSDRQDGQGHDGCWQKCPPQV